jgi:hypothetical protein
MSPALLSLALVQAALADAQTVYRWVGPLSDETTRPALLQLASDGPPGASCLTEVQPKYLRLSFAIENGRVTRAEAEGRPAPCLTAVVRGWDVSRIPNVEGELVFFDHNTRLQSLIGRAPWMPRSPPTDLDDFVDDFPDARNMTLADAIAASQTPAPPRPPEATETSRPPNVRVKAGTIQAPPDHVQTLGNTVRRYMGQVRYCYEARLKHDPDLEGHITLDVTFEGGRTRVVQVHEDATGNPVLAACVAAKVKRWRYPSEMTGEMRLPLTFELVEPAAEAAAKGDPPGTP